MRFLTSFVAGAAAMMAVASSPIDFIDTRVGTGQSATLTAGLFGKGSEEHGQTLPAVLAPHGMNFWTPQTRDTERKCIAPYYYADSLLQGFRNSHWIVGGCTQDYGSFTLMPISGELRLSPGRRGSRFSHDSEVARPDYYSVYLPDEGIKAEMTATSRAALFRFTFERGGKAYLVLNPNSDEGQGLVAVDTAAHMAYGYNPVHRIYQGKGQPAGYSGHYVMVVDKPIADFGAYVGDSPMPGVAQIGFQPGIGTYMELDVTPGETVLVKAASSFTGHEGAMSNLEAEIPGWDFDATRKHLSDAWQKRLGCIEVESDDSDALSKFYGAMYRTAFLPREVNDVDGRYPAFASGYPIMQLAESQKNYYDDYSMWDTYRALHPYLALMHPTLDGEMMQSLVLKAEQGGWMPIFPCWGSYTAAMIGDHCASAISDAYAKGIRNFDAEKAYQALRRNAFEIPGSHEYAEGKGRRALSSYLQYGYIPVEDTVAHAYHKREQASRTLEYAYDDFALAQLAKALGHDADYQVLMERAGNYANAINPATGYADGRHADGSWTADNPYTFSKHITEGAPCHYAWYVPHDPQGLIKIMGGKKQFVAKLDSMFSERRYWHGNEPCHQVAYMYCYADQPWKTSRQVRRIMGTEYLTGPGGLSGNDDAGQMSAWYIFAALGFYPVCPSTTEYAISGPTFKRAVLHLENGKALAIEAANASPENIYVREVRLNGHKIDSARITHDQLLEGGTLSFKMSNKP